jgi:site-specific DNA recombinase
LQDTVRQLQDKMIKAIAYVRVSTDQQANEGVSIDLQIEKIKQYCDLYNYELLDIIVDAGISAKSLKRPGITNVLHCLAGNKADALVVYKLCRLTRSLSDWSELIKLYFNEKSGKTLLAVVDQIDTSTASGRLCLNMMMTVYQWEREVISERTKAALQHKKSKGQPLGSAKFGENITQENITPNSNEQEILNLILKLRSESRTLQHIADHLNQNNVLTKRNRIWYQRTVKNVIDNSKQYQVQLLKQR